MAKISICVPTYPMENGAYFLERNLLSISAQDYKNHEIIVSDNSPDDTFKPIAEKYGARYYKNPKLGMANNTNFAISKAEGELIKILFQDDYFYHTKAIRDIVLHFTPNAMWLVTSCTHSMDGVNTFNDHDPFYSESENTIGSPSVLTIRCDVLERFDPNFKWALDLDLYKRLFRVYDKPKILDKINVVIGIGFHQETNKLSEAQKIKDHQLLKIKFETYENFIR